MSAEENNNSGDKVRITCPHCHLKIQVSDQCLQELEMVLDLWDRRATGGLLVLDAIFEVLDDYLQQDTE